MTICLMHIACWIIKATNTHTQNTQWFPLQQSSHELASILRSTHIAYLVYIVRLRFKMNVVPATAERNNSLIFVPSYHVLFSLTTKIIVSWEVTLRSWADRCACFALMCCPRLREGTEILFTFCEWTFYQNTGRLFYKAISNVYSHCRYNLNIIFTPIPIVISVMEERSSRNKVCLPS
jgi:hypothetical protein